MNANAIREHVIGRHEMWALAGLLFALPLLEAPKNGLWLVFFGLWVMRALTRRTGWGGAWSAGRDLPFVALLIASVVVVAAADPYPSRWRELVDVFRYTVLGWLLARSQLDMRQWRTLLLALLAGTLAATIFGWWQWQVAHATRMLELHSVGHTNHSAIFLVIVALTTQGVLLMLWSRMSAYQRIGLVLVTGILSLSVVLGESRGATISLMVGALAQLWWLPPPAWRGRLVLGFTLLLLVALAWDGYLINKTMHDWQGQKTSTTFSSFRIELMRTAWLTAEQRPLTGVGLSNFSLVTPEKVAGWLAERGQVYDAARYFHAGHAHSLYANTLAERGILGVAALLMLALAWLKALRKAPHSLAWAVGLSGFVGVFVAGIFNTTLHGEHGMLAMVTMGLLLSGNADAAVRDAPVFPETNPDQ